MKEITGKKLYKKLRDYSADALVAWKYLPRRAQDRYDELADLFACERFDAYHEGYCDGLEDALSD